MEIISDGNTIQKDLLERLKNLEEENIQLRLKLSESAIGELNSRRRERVVLPSVSQLGNVELLSLQKLSNRVMLCIEKKREERV